MVLLLFGPPGCGKGTQSRLITEWLKIPAISTGEMLRSEVATGTASGEAAKSVMASGGLVRDEVVNRMLAWRIAQPDCARGFLLDGYPRTVQQAEYLDTVLQGICRKTPLVLHLDVAADALVTRLSSRRQCPNCARIYNLLHQSPGDANLCENDGTPLITRKDDDEAVIRERLRMYDEMTRPVLAHYPGNYLQIRGDRSPNYVFKEITDALEPLVLRNGFHHGLAE